jgi:hypothetical protein
MTPPLALLPRRAVLGAAVALAVVLGAVALSGGRESAAGHGPRPFLWLHPEQPPQGWKVAVTGSGAALAYPPVWREIPTDPGTASAAPAGARGAFASYLMPRRVAARRRLRTGAASGQPISPRRAPAVCASRLPRQGWGMETSRYAGRNSGGERRCAP